MTILAGYFRPIKSSSQNMKKHLRIAAACLSLLGCSGMVADAQITLLKDYKNYTSAPIGVFQGINYREAGFSALYSIPGTNGKEFWICSDRGVNIDCANANPAGCTPMYDKLYGFAGYAPKIHRVRVNGDSVQILQTITMKRPNGTNATGVLNPTGYGSTATEEASTDTVLNCANYAAKLAPKDIWAIDAEAIAVDKDGYFWISEEGGPTIWKLNKNGVVVKRYTPFANLPGAQAIDVQIDTAFKYRKNNRGFENLTIAPNGKIYALIQSPLLYPTKAIGEASQVHRMLEIDPATNATRMMVYMNDGVIGAAGANQIRLQDWKLGDMTAINDTTFLVLEAAARGTTDIKRMYKINITGATSVTSGLYGTQTVESLTDSAGLAGKGIVPVKKTLFMNLLANGWPSSLDKAEGLTIINDSTIALCNDNDYGQSCPLANGIGIATNNLSHLIVYGLQGANKLTYFQRTQPTYSQGITGPSTSTTPYLVPTIPNASTTSIMTVGDAAPNGYKMVGIPDGLGAFDNGNGTFTLVMNHEIGTAGTPPVPLGSVRAHGSAGAFVSKWIIDKNTLSVLSGADLIQTIKLWNPATNSYISYNGTFPTSLAALNRFCSADLAPVSAFYNDLTGKGTQERIFMNGEESGNEGRAFGHIITGPNGGNSYELPYLGKFSWENAVASPRMSDTTVVAGMDDATPGQVYFYMGAKTTTGTEIEKAGLAGGHLYSVAVNGLLTEASASTPAANTPFSMVDLGLVQNMTGTTLNSNSNNAGVTTFLRPEDGAWDPSNPSDFYFNTTDAFNAPSRLWKLHFANPGNITQGGTITAVLDGTEGQQMLDNMAIDNSGHIILVEDVGSNAHVGKVWEYTIATDALKQIASHDSTRFYTGGANFLTIDEEASGQIDVQNILGPGMFLTSVQAHYNIPGELVEGGQLLALYNPGTALANPEIALQGNNITIVDGSTTPVTTNNTDFGNVNTGASITKTFSIMNSGPGSLVVNGISFTGTNAAAYTLVTPPAFPLTLAANASQTITIQFLPATDGAKNATLNIMSNDLDEQTYDVALKGTGVSPDIRVAGNNVVITDGDPTAGPANNTDFGTVNTGSNVMKTFMIRNTGAGELKVSGITFTGTQSAEFTLAGAPAFPLTIAGVDSQAITVQFAPTAQGIRTATMNVASNDADAATYDFAIQGIGRSATGIASVNGDNSFAKLYPNPTSEAATVAITLKKEERVIVSMFSIDGKEMIKAVDQKMQAGEQQIVLNTSSLPGGTYFVQIATDSQVTKMKLSVAH